MNNNLQQALTRLLGRKFIITVGMLASAHWLMNYGHITANVYMYVILGTVAAYITGNVTQNIKLAATPPETTSVGGVSYTNTIAPIPSTAVDAIVSQIKSSLRQSKLL